MNDKEPLHLFAGYGVELEYMIVDRETLQVLPVCDRLLARVGAAESAEVELGPLAWSNELVLHVVELKTNGPAAALETLPPLFQHDVRRIDALLGEEGACLLPTGMHPTMDPHRDTRIWPHEYTDVYRAYDRIFGCRGHGWSNLQSTHLNLPFNNDEEFGRLHAAIRLVLPILPALAASSPIVDGRITGALDNRLEAYRLNQVKVPECAGHIIPEAVYTAADYSAGILEPLYRAIAPHDAAGILRHEWLNSRGAIARFERSAIEIRLLDIQECPAADLALLALIVAVLRAMTDMRLASDDEIRTWDGPRLARILGDTIRDAEATVLVDSAYLRLFGYPEASCRAGDLWRYLAGQHLVVGSPWRPALDVVFDEGTLARRILRAVGPEPAPARLLAVYRELAGCVRSGELFHA